MKELQSYQPVGYAPYRQLRIVDEATSAQFELQRLRSALEEGRGRAVSVPGEGGLAAVALAAPRAVDSACLGVRVGSVEHLSVGAGVPEDRRETAVCELLNAAADAWRQEFDVVALLVDCGWTALGRALQARGAQTLAVNCSWVARTVAIPRERLEPRPGFQEGWLEPGDHEAFSACVRSSFSTYRSHWHADQRLEGADCSGPYVKFVEQHVADGGRLVVTRDDAGEIIAFVTINPHTELNAYLGRLAVGELSIGGVDPGARGRGAYEAFVVQGLRWFVEEGYEHVVLRGNVCNASVQGTWIRIGGFRPREYRFRFHWWL